MLPVVVDCMATALWIILSIHTSFTDWQSVQRLYISSKNTTQKSQCCNGCWGEQVSQLCREGSQIECKKKCRKNATNNTHLATFAFQPCSTFLNPQGRPLSSLALHRRRAPRTLTGLHLGIRGLTTGRFLLKNKTSFFNFFFYPECCMTITYSVGLNSWTLDQMKIQAYMGMILEDMRWCLSLLTLPTYFTGRYVK